MPAFDFPFLSEDFSFDFADFFVVGSSSDDDDDGDESSRNPFFPEPDFFLDLVAGGEDSSDEVSENSCREESFFLKTFQRHYCTK